MSSDNIELLRKRIKRLLSIPIRVNGQIMYITSHRDEFVKEIFKEFGESIERTASNNKRVTK